MGYFLDTYAIIEFLKGNKNYIKFFKKKNITTRLNLMELYYRILREFDKKAADKFYAMFLACVVDFDDNLIKEAMKFRLKMKKGGKDISYTDAIGYLVAKKNKVKFLTGDEEFRRLPNVKFVK